MPTFTNAVNGNDMVDAYLVDYSKTIYDIEQLIFDYGENGRNFMVNFFIADSVYVIISCTMFSLLIQCVSDNKYLKFIPILTGVFDTIENVLVLYSGLSLNMAYLPQARLFATIKACSLFISLIVIVVSWLYLRKGKKVETGRIDN